jgi:hypothetical protein
MHHLNKVCLLERKSSLLEFEGFLDGVPLLFSGLQVHRCRPPSPSTLDIDT